MGNGVGVAHLVMDTPPASPSLTYPVPLPLCPLLLPWDHLPAGMSFVRSFVAISLVLAVDDLKTIACIWWSFKLRPFSIAISIFIIAHFSALLKW